jgi:hypothetical protein
MLYLLSTVAFVAFENAAVIWVVIVLLVFSVVRASVLS